MLAVLVTSDVVLGNGVTVATVEGAGSWTSGVMRLGICKAATFKSGGFRGSGTFSTLDAARARRTRLLGADRI